MNHSCPNAGGENPQPSKNIPVTVFDFEKREEEDENFVHKWFLLTFFSIWGLYPLCVLLSSLREHE